MKAKSPRHSQKIRRSAEQWQKIMLSYDQSGLTQDAFCAREALAPSSFYTWRKRLERVKPAETKEPLFVELASPQLASTATDWDIEVSLGDHIVLRLRQPR